MDENLTLPTMLERTAEKYGARPAMVYNERTVTYAGLAADVRTLAGAFAARGVQKGDCVAIIHRNSPDFVAAYFALNRLGAVAVPINFMVSKADELAFMLNDCRAVGVVTQKEFAANVAGARALVPAIKTVWTTDVDAPAPGGEDLRALRKEQRPFTAPVPVPQDVACILYTSGTTGKPKGVMLTHRNLVSNASDSGKSLELSYKDVFLCILPMFHTFAWTACVCIPILNGAKIVVVPSITPPKPWLELMAKHKVTLFAAVPQLYSALAKQAKGFKGLVLRFWFFRKVRFGVSGAAPLSLETLRLFESRIGVPILEGFGMTETSPVATVNMPAARKPGTVGRPIENVLVRVVDEAEKPLGPGQEGEICVKGPNIMKGYFNNPEATAAAFTKDGWLKTGDIGVVDAEGYLSIRDRMKDMIIVKGLKVFPAMLEQEIAAFPGVEEAAVVGVPNGDGDEIIKLFLVAKKGEAVEKAAMQKFLKEKFDPYKRPRDIEIVESLPKNALQKVLKHVLRKQELERAKAARN